MFILRARAPERYGKWRDGMQASRGHADGAARTLQQALHALTEDNRADAAGKPRPERPPHRREWLLDDPAEQAAFEEQQEHEADAKREASRLAYLRTLDAQTGAGVFGPDYSDDVARSS